MEKKWEDMTAEEKREARFEIWTSPKDPEGNDLQFQSPEAEANYKATVQRFKEIMQLKKPDRVPIVTLCTFMAADLYGVTPGEFMNNPEKLASISKQYLEDYRPDFYMSPALVGTSKVFEILDYKMYRWPGHGVSEDSVYQCIEDEYMRAEDYQALIDDPSDFWLRTYLPRVFGALEPFKNIPPFTELWEMPVICGNMIPLGIPDVQNALKALLDAGREAFEWAHYIMGFETEAKSMGFVSAAGGISKAPFDILADTLRGTRAVMMDIFRRPDMVLKAIETITPLAIKQGVGGATFQGNPAVFIPLHKGADGFMSDEQFKTFYWPGLKEVILGLAAEGCVPCLFCEGSYNTRLEYLKELPKGSCLWIFDRTDMAKAKEMLGDTLCLGGNVPAGLILTGTAQQVKDYCKNLIDVVGKDGGYIMGFGTAMDQGKPDTIHAMIDFTKEYGVYK
ncbi:MAG: uroporphyrinogen decarboxylase [Deltaproteobacteria bacterium]|nr:uroporphyrinogen decarboxylase [Deltaproteobacteria bacterium]